MMITEIKLMGDSNTEYTITVNANGSASCSCPAYRYAKNGLRFCKHIDFAAHVLVAAPAPV